MHWLAAFKTLVSLMSVRGYVVQNPYAAKYSDKHTATVCVPRVPTGIRLEVSIARVSEPGTEKIDSPKRRELAYVMRRTDGRSASSNACEGTSCRSGSARRGRRGSRSGGSSSTARSVLKTLRIVRVQVRADPSGKRSNSSFESIYARTGNT